MPRNESYFRCQILRIQAKSWGYIDDNPEDPVLTGNFYIEAPFYEPQKRWWLDDDDDVHETIVYDTVNISEIGKALQSLVDNDLVNYNATPEEIEKVWNEQIEYYNKHMDLYCKKFSAKHKKFYKQLTKGYSQFYFTESMIAQTTEKAIRIEHPIVGSQWIPKSVVKDYTKDMTDGYRKYLLQYTPPEKELYVPAFICNNFKNL